MKKSWGLMQVTGKLYFLNYSEVGRPIEENYVVEIDDDHSSRKSFAEKAEALIYLFDNDVKTYKFLTKEISQYSSIKNLLNFEFWHLKNRIGYVTYDYEQYVDESRKVQKRRAYIFRFVGFGRSCFAETKEQLKEKVLAIISEYKKDPEGKGCNTYPYYTKYNREEQM